MLILNKLDKTYQQNDIILMLPFLPWLNEKEEKKKQNQEPIYQELPLSIEVPKKEEKNDEDKKDGIIIIEVF